MNDTNAESFDLLEDNDDRYVPSRNPEGSGVWGMNRVVSTQVPTGTVYVFDSSAVTLFASPMTVEADYALYFITNPVVLRVELVAACVAQQYSTIGLASSMASSLWRGSLCSNGAPSG